MGFVPPGAQWYIAELIEEFRRPSRRTSWVWINSILIAADSPEEAYRKAIAFGRKGSHRYKNVYGETVTCKFRGLYDLSVLWDDLKDGCELSFRTKERLTPAAVAKLVRKKKSLHLFAKNKSTPNPKALLPQSIARELKSAGCKF